MTTIHIACDNCGAKYKLPETFTSPRAKCQKCGSAIDVAAQRSRAESDQADTAGASAAARPAGSKPAAAARPAVDRSKAKPPAARVGSKGGPKAGATADKPARPGRAGSRRRKGGDGDGEGDGEAGAGHHHHHHRRHPTKKDNTPMIFGGIGLVAIVIVVVVFMMQMEDPAETSTAQTPPANQTQNDGDKAPAAKPADKPADDKPADASTGDATVDPAGDKPAEGTKPDEGSKPNPAEASAPAPKLPPDAPKWMRLKIQTMDEVTDPKTYDEVPWDRLDAAQKAMAQEWASDFAGGGRAGKDAEAAMREKNNRYLAVFGLIDLMRGLNYADPFDTMTGYAINRFLTEITDGLQAGFVAAELDENIDPRKVQWNNNTIKTWLKFFPGYEDEAAFTKGCRERRAKAAKEARDTK